MPSDMLVDHRAKSIEFFEDHFSKQMIRHLILLLTIVATPTLSIASTKQLASNFRSAPQITKILEVPSLSDGYPKPCRIKLTPPSGVTLGQQASASLFRMCNQNITISPLALYA
jgi:hypothetical protein